MQSFQVTSAREIQRNYRKLFDSVKKTKTPLFVMKGTDVDVVILDAKTYERLKEREKTSSPIQISKITNNSTLPRVPWRK